MDFVVRISEKAYREYFNAYEWYDEQQADLGSRFEDSLYKKINLVSKNPLIYGVKKLNTREAHLENFPYVIVYKIIQTQNTILIISIFHTSRNPKRKYRR